MMRKSQIEAIALTAMRDAVARNFMPEAIIYAGEKAMHRHRQQTDGVFDPNGDYKIARALYDKHFTVMGPN